ncbi:MAG: hypothetical protein WBC74_05320 [Candidatus Omnitrophota bacterium]
MGTGFIMTLRRILKPVPIVLIIWCILWLNFIARDLYKRGLWDEYKILARSNAEEKRAYTYGKRFYEFLKFAKDNIPPDTFYDFEGIDNFSLESRRGIYYLYPDVKTEYPAYILVYDRPGFAKSGFVRYATLDNGRFILKRR